MKGREVRIQETCSAYPNNYPMKPLIHPRLINKPFGDPGVYVEIKWEKRAILFDIGDISSLDPAKLLKVSDVFVSHTHMDHFIGFDHLLRLILSRDKKLRIYGPPGTIACIEGKLRGYTWNLTGEYPLSIQVSEVYPDRMERKVFYAQDGFKPRDLDPLPFSGILREEDMITICTAHLDHKIVSLGFALKERFHININREALDTLGLPVGPWLRAFKQELWEGKSDDDIFTVSWEKGNMKFTRDFTLGSLKRKIATITEGQKISYIVDAIYSQENVEKILELVRDSDVMFCEAAYAEVDREIASDRFHLTAEQAGRIARMGGVKNLVIFHFSPRYKENPSLLYEEAKRAFKRE